MVSLKSLLSIAILLVLELTIVTHGFYTCSNPSSYVGQLVCDHWNGLCGECVSFVKRCTDDRRQTSVWRRGRKVRGANILYGTAIATFPTGKYYGHAAIYVSQNSAGIQVYDQWKGNQRRPDQPVSQRTIRWNGNPISNNGASFYVIE